MGRRAKHSSDAERALAQRSWSTKYNQSPRGKEIRAAENALRHSRKVSKHSIPRLPPLRDSIERLAQLPLPEGEELYKLALESPHNLSEDDLWRWKKEPPFEADANIWSPDPEGYTRNLQIVLHGVRMREQLERDTQRRAEFSRLGKTASYNLLRDEVADLLCGWEHVTALNVYDPDVHPREHAMLQHFIQWQARTIYHLYRFKF